MSEASCLPTPEAKVPGNCWPDPDVSQYVCPSNSGHSGGGSGNSAGSTTNCLGAVETPMGVNQGCPNALPTPSELAWDARYTTAPQQGGAYQLSQMESYRKYKKMKAKYKALVKSSRN